MGQLRRFFLRKDKTNPEISRSSVPTALNGPEVVKFGEDLFEIRSLNFMGRGIRSANQRWFLAYGQIHDPNASNWSSDDPTGALILYDHGKLVTRLDGLCRPETVAICDAGVFAVYEWGPSCEFLGPRCLLQVFTAVGERIFRHRAGAAIELPTISADGKLLAFLTLAAARGSSRPEDGESIFLIDLVSSAILWQEEVPAVWPSALAFDGAACHVLLYGQEGQVFRYTYEGEFLDKKLVADHQLKCAQTDEYGYQLLEHARTLFNADSTEHLRTETFTQITDLIRQALGKKLSPSTQASAHRLIGELLEMQGDIQSALNEYTLALDLNPKIGLKRKVQAMRSVDR